jgi:hypothetical protein
LAKTGFEALERDFDVGSSFVEAHMCVNHAVDDKLTSFLLLLQQGFLIFILLFLLGSFSFINCLLFLRLFIFALASNEEMP